MRTFMLFDAIVAAGGFGTRLGGTKPKSLIRAGNVALIEITIAGLVNAGMHRILVTSNRPEWVSDLANILSPFPEALICQDPGYDTTLDLVRDYLSLMKDMFVFVYGHAPQPSRVYERLSESGFTASTTFPCSSKQRPIEWFEGQFLEPPYFLNRHELGESDSKSWDRFFYADAQDLKLVAGEGPGEFNYPSELERFIPFAHQLRAEIVSDVSRRTA